MTITTTLEPIIITPSEHPITLGLIDDDALFVMRKLNSAGFSSYLVGGGVRDLYLGKTPKDFDISTDARPGQVRRLFTNSRTIGRRFRLVQVYFKKGKIIEISTLRSLSEHDLDGPEAVLAPNNTYGSLDQDAQRRDITINSLFYEIENQTIIDYVGGVADLDRSIVRIIGDPDKRINRDPVRMLRVIRHCARNNFVIEANSWQAVCRNSNKLRLCPAARLRDEFLKDLYGGATAPWFRLAVDSGLFVELFELYRPILDATLPDGTTCRMQLESIFKTIDGLNGEAVAAGSHRQPDYFLLALILLPWSQVHFAMIDLNLKGPQLYQQTKQVREAIGEAVGQQLHLTRSARQEISTLLTNLPNIIHHQQNDSWPKWLKKKSYFAQCRLLYYFYRQAVQGIPVPPESLASQPSHGPIEPVPRFSKESGSARKGRPAFSSHQKGGIFGLKK